MKKGTLYFLLFLMTFFSFKGLHAQITLNPADTTVCPGENYSITGAFSSQFGAISIDDIFGGVVNIGFDFVYFGQTYSQCVISANNFISFDLSKANQYSNWTYSGALTSGDINNAIMFPFQDVHMGQGGNIYYQTLGAAPYRKFIVQFCKCPMFSCTSTLVTNELILYETTNVIEIHITSNITCSWNGGTAVEGLRSNGLQALVPGRDMPNLPWSATNDARRFTPTSATTYQIDTITFAPIPILQNANANNIVWYAAGNPNTPIGTGATVNVTADANIPYYVATISGQTCESNTVMAVSDTSWVTMGTVYDTLNVDICAGETYAFYGRLLTNTGTFDTVLLQSSGCDSFIRLNLFVNPLPNMNLTNNNADQIFCKGSYHTMTVNQAFANYTYSWEYNGQTINGANGPSYTTGNPGDYQVFAVTDKGCTDSSIIVHVSKDSVIIDFDVIPILGCYSDTVRIENNGDLSASYTWNFGDNTMPLDTNKAPIHVYAQQGIYNIKVVAMDSLGCKDSVVTQVDLLHPLKASFTQTTDSVCQGSGTVISFFNTSVGAETYFWDFRDGSTSTIKNPNHVFTSAGSHDVMLVVFNDIPCSDTFYHTIYVDSFPTIKLTGDRREICVGETVELYLDYLNTAKSVSWNFDDGTIWDQPGSTKIVHAFDKPGNYIIEATVDYLVCEDISDTFLLKVHAYPKVDLGEDTVLCLQGQPIELKNHAGNPNNAKFYWNTGDTTAVIYATHEGNYTLTVSSNDCAATESVIINKDCYTDIPNAFTPNGDGENDYFLPRQLLSKGVTNFNMTIFSRWGQKMFETSQIDGRGWDGKLNGKDQPQGVYIYTIDVTYKSGRTEQYTGNVTLIR